MQLYNQTNNHTLTSDLHNRNSFFNKSLGLIGAKTIQAIYFTTRWGIHTFGVRKPLTIIVCTKHLQKFIVQAIKSPLRPNHFYFYNPQYQHIFELPYQQYPVKIGDELITKD